MASGDFIQAINKHVMGDRSEFDALKERFQEDFYWCADKSIAAALAYMIAKGELEAEKEEEEEEEPDVYDEAVEVIKKYCHPPGNNSAHTATDEIFTLIYKWLDKSLAEKNYGLLSSIRRDIEELFLPFVIAKPKA
jgi:hypothetical protein